MELEQQEINEDSKNIGIIIMGILITLIPISIALMINNPEWIQYMKTSKEEILRGSMMGVSILPVFLFVTIKGGDDWYKRKWVWALITIVIVALLGITTLMTPQVDMINDIGPIYY